MTPDNRSWTYDPIFTYLAYILLAVGFLAVWGVIWLMRDHSKKVTNARDKET